MTIMSIVQSSSPKHLSLADLARLNGLSPQSLHQRIQRGLSLLEAALLSTEQLRTLRSKHNKSDTPLYAVWQQMRYRCQQPTNNSFHHYGERGIKVCERWNDFSCFLEDMGERPSGATIERIDNNGIYEPSNCKWATAKEQSRNKSSTVFLSHGGKTMCLSDWAAALGMTASSLHGRIHRYGWTIEDALTRTPQHSKRGKAS